MNPNIFTYEEGTDIEWGGESGDPPDDKWEDWPADFEEQKCPFALHMRSIYVPGLITVVCLGTGLLGLTLALSWFSFRKWKQVGI